MSSNKQARKKTHCTRPLRAATVDRNMMPRTNHESDDDLNHGHVHSLMNLRDTTEF